MLEPTLRQGESLRKPVDWEDELFKIVYSSPILDLTKDPFLKRDKNRLCLKAEVMGRVTVSFQSNIQSLLSSDNDII